MPRPLPCPGSPEGALDALLRDEPCDSDLRKMVADGEMERGMELGAVRRGVEDVRDRLGPLGLRLPSLDHLTTLRGATLAEEEAERIGATIRALLAVPNSQVDVSQIQELERSLSAALGPAGRGDVMLQLLDKEGQLDVQPLQEQYDFQRTLLASLGLLKMQGNQLGIAGIDDRFHPLPSLDAIQNRLRSPVLRRKIAQGFNQLLLVPFGLPLQRLLGAWRKGLLRNEHLLQAKGGLNRSEPLWVWGAYDHELLVYVPQRFTANHGGHTKRDLLAGDRFPAWQVLLTEGDFTNLPCDGESLTLVQRPQLECGWTPREYLQVLQDQGEAGWTPETYAIAFLTSLERSGRVLDHRTYTHLTASYLPTSAHVPRAYWCPRNYQANLSAYGPGSGGPHGGARAAVRVL